MSFIKDLFRDNNDINEKSVVGFISFAVIIITAILDLITGALGKQLVLNKFIFEGLIVITLGSFGIASIDKWTNRKTEIEKEKLSTGEEE